MDSLWLLIYSKFSPACSEMINIINTNTIKVHFDTLCIDNSELRKRVLTSKKLGIEHVPCILYINKASGVVEKYEGEKSFEILDTLIVSQPMEQFQESQTMQPSQSQHSPVPVQSSHVHQPSELTTMIDDLDGMDIQQQPIVNVPGPVKQKVSPSDIMAVSKGRDSDVSIGTNPSMAISSNAQQQVTVQPIEQKKTGKPVDIAAAMAAAQGRRE